jgi:hypothetical protein
VAMGIGCAGTPELDSPRAVAREDCREWLGRVAFAQGVRRGTSGWDQLLGACISRRMGVSDSGVAALEIDRALESRPQ